jgi:hypothetical protein
MAILAVFSGQLTTEQYDVLRTEIDWEHKHPAGAVFHAAASDGQGHVHAADVWESQEALDAFVQTALMPAFQRHGFPPPTVAVYPAHRVLVYPAAEKYRI